MEIIGYARVSTREQNLDLQLDALKEAGCKLIFEEKVSGVKDRPELDKALAYLREGDTFVIWKLDRLGRSLKDLVYIVDCLQKRKVAFNSIVDGIDTNFSGECPTLIVHNMDQPGHVSEVTSMLAYKSVNIATMQLYRSAKGGNAVMVVECDQQIPKEGIEWLKHVEGILKVTYFAGI